jgi:cytochrome c biogenesis protein CcdA
MKHNNFNYPELIVGIGMGIFFSGTFLSLVFSPMINFIIGMLVIAIGFHFKHKK